MSIEGTGITVNFGNLSMNLNDVDIEPDFYSTDKPTYDGLEEGQTITAIVKFEPFIAPAIPNLAPFIITYVENRLKKRKKRPNGTMVKHSRRKVDKCKVKIAFDGVVESSDGNNVTIRKV